MWACRHACCQECGRVCREGRLQATWPEKAPPGVGWTGLKPEATHSGEDGEAHQRRRWSLATGKWGWQPWQAPR